ncbi:ligase-associated DNA damage response endonuclease PdeM [Arenibacter sp. BSSL-BM3]|uniref:Ligase-associated DNA damage response endonuclease PdeM n=1 Tax=Arenibacter arenosicollis TaxID=2762274 RepID=A0ABR7QS13_9FLAO|nr:ligase-associated DNA damage response endonuclease PdeM [Arenibacter arenosicollis]MBC8769971.1 ligase-associated DNA damage response endonuclease PdeM [Arenibacter arenosicollis]
MEISICNQLFTLHPSGAIYWQNQNMVMIADVHLGKVTHFRKYGSAIPQSAINANFERLNEVLSCFNPAKIGFLGDLFHSSLNKEWNYFESWVKSQTAKIILIKGNHDIISPTKFLDLDIELVEELIMDKFLLTHHPENRSGLFNISGHIHPGINIRGSGRQSLKVPCFHRQVDQIILPAFGAFTGKFLVKPRSGDKIYATTKDEVIMI